MEEKGTCMVLVMQVYYLFQIQVNTKIEYRMAFF
jgi:hypothetical protein